MAYNYEYPYTDPTRGNADWIINKIKELSKDFDEFVLKNQIKYADPLQWSIARQYEKYTIVTNENIAYLSKNDVPMGINLDNENYWLKIADFGELYNTIKDAISVNDDGASTTSTENREVGSLVWLDNVLYKVLRFINVGDAYILTGENANVEVVTIEYLIKNNIVEIADLNNRMNNAENSILINTENIANNTTAISSITEKLIPLEKSSILTINSFGAIGDGVTDDTQAIKDAIEYAELHNRELYMLGGTYLISDTLYIPSNFTFAGISRSRCILKMKAGINKSVIKSVNFDSLNRGITATQPNKICLYNFTIDMLGNSDGDGIDLFASESLVKDIYMHDIGGTGLFTNGNGLYSIYPSEGIESTFENIYIIRSGKHGVHFIGPTDSFFNNITCVNPCQIGVGQNYYNFLLAGSGARIVHFHGWNFHDDFGLIRPKLIFVATNCSAVEIVDSHIEGGSTGVAYIDDSAQGVVFTNCRFYAGGGDYLIYHYGKFCQYIGCWFDSTNLSAGADTCIALVSIGGTAPIYNVFDGVSASEKPFVAESPQGTYNTFRISNYTTNPNYIFSTDPNYQFNTYLLSNGGTDNANNRHINFTNPVCVNGVPLT